MEEPHIRSPAPTFQALVLVACLTKSGHRDPFLFCHTHTVLLWVEVLYLLITSLLWTRILAAIWQCAQSLCTHASLGGSLCGRVLGTGWLVTCQR
jgi:hypothetical protein